MVMLYHGTTEERYRSILKSGFDHDKVIWDCSDPDKMYFYRQDMVAREFGLSPEMAKERCFEMALQSAFTSAALTNSQSKNLFVVEVQIPDSHLNVIEADQSTGLTEDSSVCVSTAALAQFPCSIYAAPDCYSPMFTGLFLSTLTDREHLSLNGLTDLERTVIESMSFDMIQNFLDVVSSYLLQQRLTQLYQNIRVGPAMEQPQKMPSIREQLAAAKATQADYSTARQHQKITDTR